MELNQTNLRGILAEILSVDENHIIPKQGNWYNPQEKRADVENWCAYRIKSNKPRTVPFFQEEESGTNTVCAEKIADIELQFVGPESEELAQSVTMWPFRSDVKKYFQNVNGSLMNDDMNAISSFFAQDGANTITAWNVTIRILWTAHLDTNQKILKSADLNGQIK